MATLGRGYSFGATESVTNSKLHSLIDSGTVSSIVNADVDAAAAIGNSKLNLASISQAVTMTGGLTISSSGLTLSSVIQKLAKGADVASVAGAMTLGDDGNYFDITGTNAITSITAKTAGTIVVLQFDSTATLTDGSNLKLNGNFTGAAEAQIMLVSDGTNWFEVCRNTGVNAVASQSDMESATSNTVAVTPAVMKHHPAMPKVWAIFAATATGTNDVLAGYGASSVTRNSAGNYTLNMSSAFSNTNYAFNGNVMVTANNGYRVVNYISKSASAIRFNTNFNGDTNSDGDEVSVFLYGDM